MIRANTSQQSQFKARSGLPVSEKIRRSVLELDSFGQPLQLLVKKNEKHQTFFGGCMTFVIAFVTGFFFYTQLAQMVQKQNPLTLSAEHHFEKPTRVVLTPDTFSIALAIEDGYTLATYKNESIYNVIFQHCKKTTIINETTGEKIPKFECRNIPLETCELEKHFKVEELVEYYSRFDLKTLYCLNYDSWITQPPEIEGDFDSDIWQWSRFIVSKCANSTENNNSCAPQAEIDQQLSSGYVAVYFSDKMSDLNQPGDPSTIVGKDIFTTFSYKLSKEVNIYLRHILTDSDDGFITEDVHSYDYISFNRIYELLDTREKGDFLQISLRLENKKTMNLRQYLKLQDILGNVGGLWQFLALIGAILVIPVNKLDLQLKILNQIFTFEVDTNQEEKQKIRTLKNLEAQDSVANRQMVSQSNNRLIINIVDNIEHYNKDEQQVIKMLQSKGQHSGIKTLQDQELSSNRIQRHSEHKLTKKVYGQLQEYIAQNNSSSKFKTMKSVVQRVQKKNIFDSIFKSYFKLSIGKLSLKYYEYITFFFGCSSKETKNKKEQINFGIRKLEKQIDILYVIKKLTELEKLKILLLSSQQLKLFDYLPKPCIPKPTEGEGIQQKFESLLAYNDENKQMSYWQFIQGEKTIYQRAAEAFQAFEEIQKKKQKSDIDKKLLKGLDGRIKRLFACSIINEKNVEEQDLNEIMGLSDKGQSSIECDDVLQNQQIFDEQIISIDRIASVSKRSKNM